METMSQRHPIAVFSGTGNPALAEAIAQRLGIPLGGLRITRFPDTEVYVKFEESVRGSDVFLIQPTCAPIDGNLMELLIAVDALKRAAAYRITCVIPYYGYARQEKKDRPREPITAKLIADLFKTAGADRLMTVDLHTSQIQGFFDGPVDHLFAMPLLSAVLLRRQLPTLAAAIAHKQQLAVRYQRALATLPQLQQWSAPAGTHWVRYPFALPFAVADKARRADKCGPLTPA